MKQRSAPPSPQNEKINSLNISEKPPSRHERKIALLTVVAIGVATVTAAIFYVQLRVMTKQTEILSEEASASAASASFSAVQMQERLNSAQQQVNVAQKSLSALHAQMVLTERPWVGIIGFQTQGGKEAGNTFYFRDFRIIFQNSGRTPALKTRIAFAMFSRGFDKPVGDYDAESKALESKAALGEKSFKSKALLRWEKNWRARLKKERNKIGESIAPHAIYPWNLGGVKTERQNKNGWPLAFYIMGKITYHDTITTKVHTTEFCFSHDVGTSFIPCPSGNWMN